MMTMKSYTLIELKALIGKTVFVCFGKQSKPQKGMVEGLFTLNKIDYKVKVKFENNKTLHILYPHQIGTTEKEALDNFVA